MPLSLYFAIWASTVAYLIKVENSVFDFYVTFLDKISGPAGFHLLLLHHHLLHGVRATRRVRPLPLQEALQDPHRQLHHRHPGLHVQLPKRPGADGGDGQVPAQAVAKEASIFRGRGGNNSFVQISQFSLC